MEDQNTKETSEYPRDIFASLARAIMSWNYMRAGLSLKDPESTYRWFDRLMRAGLSEMEVRRPADGMEKTGMCCAEIARSFVAPSH